MTTTTNKGIRYDRLYYLNNKVNHNVASQAEKDELMELLYRSNHITESQYNDYKAGRNADSIIKTGLIVAGILLLGFLLDRGGGK